MPTPNILVITKGHPFDRGAFFDLFDGFGFQWTHVEQPAARVFCQPEMAADYDALVFYDMPGIRFGPDGATFEEPTEAYKQGFLELMEAGKGVVFMHHAIAGWPAWPEYAEIVGGRFLYLPGELRGKSLPDSGYRHSVTHTLNKSGSHPITDSLPDSFSMTDELYLYEVFADSVEPLLTSDYSFTAEQFYSAAKVVQEGKMFNNDGWQHEPGLNYVAWVKHYLNSPISYIQGGDDPVAWESGDYQSLLKNAIEWVISDAAKRWARQRNSS